MTGSRAFRFATPVLCALAGLLAVTSAPAASASAAPAPAAPAVPAAVPAPSAAAGSGAAAPGPVTAALQAAFAAGRHLPAAAVGGIASGTLHVGSAAGKTWATARFLPADPASQLAAAAFQDGGDTGVFARDGGAWQLAATGLYGCGNGLPASLKTAWHLGQSSVCTASPAAERSAAQRALTALPAPARAAAAAVAAPSRAATPAQTGSPAAAGPAPAAATPAGGTLVQRITAIALSEVGASDTPPVTDFSGLDCDPFSTLVAGFSANSNGCGSDATFGVRNSNETWCSDFNKWVWQQAGVTADMNTLNAGSVSFYDWALDQGQNPQVDTGTPQAGDSVMFFSPGEFPVFADHVGIITSVNADGTIDMVNGDFAATPDIHAEYDTGISDLSAFAASVENPGEQWVLVSPPSGAQPPAPTGHLSAPAVAVAGATGQFHATGSVPGGSVSAYYWTFGDGRTTNSTGPDVTHAFSAPGTYTISVTITSSFGSIVTLERNIRVLAASSAVASVPYHGIWYDPLPILQYLFTRSAGGLAVDSWNGGSWLQQAVPGSPSATGNFTTLSYPDAANADDITPHAYYRAADGSLAQTYLTSSGWVSQELPGHPAAGAAIAATTTISGGPAVFFISATGQLSQTSLGADGWRTASLRLGGPAITARSLSLADTASGPQIFATGRNGTIMVISAAGGAWHSQDTGAAAASGGSLTALTTPDGHAAVIYAARGGGLAQAAAAGPAAAGRWDVTRLPAAPAPGSTLAATTYLLPSVPAATPGDFPMPPGALTPSGPAQPLGTEVFYLTASGSPAVTFSGAAGWQTAALPAGVSDITAVSAYPVDEQPSELFGPSAGGLAELTTGARSGDPSGSWASLALPDAPVTWPDRIVLYGADPADAAAAHTAAAAAGLPGSQVTTSYDQAWADTLSGEYLVIAVGAPALTALLFNVCGWANPSALPGGSTPFSDEAGPLSTLPGADVYLSAAGGTAADTQALATDLAFYALNATLPPGVTALPPTVPAPSTCAGSPS